MYKIIGLNTNKIYAKGDYLRDCMRKIQQDYPYSKGVLSKRTVEILYPEPLQIVVNRGA